MKARPTTPQEDDRVKLIRYSVFLRSLYQALKSKKVKDKKQAYAILMAVTEAIELTPAHNGTANWCALDDRPKSWRWCCSECLRIAYCPQTSKEPDGEKVCWYKFCPNCGCLMSDPQI